MKITFLTPSIKTGGGNRMFIEIANRLCLEHQIAIVYPNNSPERHTFTVDPAVRFIAIGKLRKNKFGKLLNLIKTIRYASRHHGSAYIIFSDPFLSIFSFFLGNGRRLRFVQSDDYRIFDDGTVLGNGYLLKIYKWLTIRSYRRRKDRFVFNSRFVYETFCRDSGRQGIPFRAVHPAIDHNVFSTEGRTSVNTRICLVARKHPSKGLTTFIDAYRNLSDRYREKIDKVTLISHDDLSAFDTEGMTILRPGNDSDIANVYRDSGIFIFPSWREGFGLPPLEAMACGCACLISASGGVDEFARDNENCLMFEPRDVSGLTTGLIRLLEEERLRTCLARRGEIAVAEYSWEQSAGQLLDVLNETDI